MITVLSTKKHNLRQMAADNLISRITIETNNYVYRTIQQVLTQYRAGDKNEKNEMGGACGTYGGGERCAQGFGGET